MKLIGYMAFGLDDGGSIVPLHQYTGLSVLEVKAAILAKAQREGFEGTLNQRLDQFRWVILPIYVEEFL